VTPKKTNLPTGGPLPAATLRPAVTAMYIKMVKPLSTSR
jgi:hypothetical protein